MTLTLGRSLSFSVSMKGEAWAIQLLRSVRPLGSHKKESDAVSVRRGHAQSGRETIIVHK